MNNNKISEEKIITSYSELMGEERLSEIYELSLRATKILSIEDVDRINEKWGDKTVKIGDEISQLLPPKTIKKAWERLVKLDAQRYFENIKFTNKKLFKNISQLYYKQELIELNNFIKSTEFENIEKAFAQPNFNDPKQEYLRLINGYYQNHKINDMSILAPKIYGKFVLYKEWLESKIDANLFIKNDLLSLTDNTYVKEKKISAPTIGLFCSLINNLNHLKRDESEDVVTYCKKICEIYELKYTDRVRQNFYSSDTNKNRVNIRKLILPKIDFETSILISEYFEKVDNKNITKTILYV